MVSIYSDNSGESTLSCVSVWQRQQGGKTDDGRTPMWLYAPCSGDRRMAKQTMAKAPTPLCPPIPSLGHRWYIEKAGRNRLWRFPADAVRHWKKPAPLCKHRRQAFPIPLPAFFAVCAMSSLTGRRLKGHVRERRRLGDGDVWVLGWAWSFWELEVEKGVLR